MPARALQPSPSCAAPVPPSGDLASWASPDDVAAARDVAGQGLSKLAIGKAAIVTLMPTPAVRYVVRPEKPGGSVSFGGLLGLHIDQAGTYRVALGSGAWIDLVAGDTATPSTSHGHGPDCSGIRKMVDFPLAPGEYTLQIGANGAEKVEVLVVRLP